MQKALTDNFNFIKEHLDATVLIGAGIVYFVVPLLLGTHFWFALSMYLIFLCFAAAIRLSGGLRSVVGLVLFSCFIRTIGIGQFAKVLLLQPTDSYMNCPELTAKIFLVGSLLLLAAAAVAKQLAPKKSLFRSVQDPKELTDLAFCFMALGLLGTTGSYPNIFPKIVPPGIFHFLALFSFNVSTICLVSAVIIRSKGQRSFNALVLLFMLIQLTKATLSVGKIEFLTPLLCYLVTCYTYRFRLTWKHAVGVVAYLIFFHQVLVPISQAGRFSIRSEKLTENVQNVVHFSKDVLSSSQNFDNFEKKRAEFYEKNFRKYSYFGAGANYVMLERLTMMRFGDELLYWVDKDQVYIGWSEFFASLHLLPTLGKTYVTLDNHLGRISKMLIPTDNYTPMSYGLFASSYAIAGWMGLILITFGTCLLLFLILHWAGPSLASSFWAIAIMVHMQHVFVESAAVGTIYFSVRTMINIYLFAMCIQYSMAFVKNRRKEFTEKRTPNINPTI